MFAAIAVILSTISSGFIKVVADRVLLFLAIKALLTFLCIIVFPIVLNNVIHHFLQIAIDSLNSVSVSGLDGSMTFSGFLGWLIQCFKFPEVLSIIVSAMQMHLMFKMIPFSPIK